MPRPSWKNPHIQVGEIRGLVIREDLDFSAEFVHIDKA